MAETWPRFAFHLPKLLRRRFLRLARSRGLTGAEFLRRLVEREVGVAASLELSDENLDALIYSLLLARRAQSVEERRAALRPVAAWLGVSQASIMERLDSRRSALAVGLELIAVYEDLETPDSAVA